MEPTFIRGARLRPSAPRILGLQLQTLTVGHLQLLLATGSPFAVPARDSLTLGDFFHAVYLCAEPWREADRNLARWWTPLFFRLWSVSLRWFDVPAELRRFRAWFEEQTELPAFRAPTDGGLKTRSSGAPGPYVRQLFLMTVLRYTEADALDCSVARANALYAAWVDWEGRGELLRNSEFDTLWEFASAEDAKRFNPDGTRKGDPAQN